MLSQEQNLRLEILKLMAEPQAPASINLDSADRFSEWILSGKLPNRPELDHEDRDRILRCLNNAALAKNALLAGTIDEALRHIDAALSWSLPLLGVEHPMAAVVDHASQPPLLRHEDTCHSAPDT